MFVLTGRPGKTSEPEPLIDWETVQRRIPWGVLLLFGGGFAMADAFRTTGLAVWLGGKMGVMFAGWPIWAVILGCCVLVTVMSEFTSNVATVNTALPVLAPLAATLNVDPRMLLIRQPFPRVSVSCCPSRRRRTRSFMELAGSRFRR